MKKQDAGMNLRSHSLDKLRQIVTTGAFDRRKPKEKTTKRRIVTTMNIGSNENDAERSNGRSQLKHARSRVL